MGGVGGWVGWWVGWVGGWVGGWGGWLNEIYVCARKVEEEEAVGMSYCGLLGGGR